jgi:hypothetical protein
MDENNLLLSAEQNQGLRSLDASELVELLDQPPLVMNTPLALLDIPAGRPAQFRRAYAAAWLPVRVTRRERVLKNGETLPCDPPMVSAENRLFIVSQDGLIFGEGGDRPLDELPFQVRLPEIPRSSRTWSSAGVKAYHKGLRPNPSDVFRRLVDVVDRFIDFDLSLAPQATLAEMVACYCLSTYLLDAFTVAGFLWSNGESGSGKTHLLLVVTELAYLGEMLSGVGTFASLRDLADYRATLAFDDAENIAEGRAYDPDKRALLLAGNRRGVTVPLKELGPDKVWRTRYVNAFAPRCFSAIGQPDAALAGRTIVIPLVRTVDRSRANADPSEIDSWPHNRRQLVDDLWALALAHLAELPQWDEWVVQHTRLAGRSLQPWRALLATAAWLGSQGVSGLWERMEALSVSYQDQRRTLETNNFITLVIQALVICAVLCDSQGETHSEKAGYAGYAGYASLKGTPQKSDYWDISTELVAEAAVKIAQEEEIWDPVKITAHRVGMALRKLHLNKLQRPSGKGPRKWRLKRGSLERWAEVYNIHLPESLKSGGDPPPPARDH